VEFSRLEAVLGAARDGVAATVLVEGDAGIGKTTLVDAVAARAAEEGWRVLVGHCLRLGETPLSYAPFVEALRGARDEVGIAGLEALAGAAGGLAGSVPELRSPGEGSLPIGAMGQQRLFGLMLEFVVELAGEDGVVLVVEDLHWADPSSADMFLFVARTLRRAPVVLIATLRSDEPPTAPFLRPMLAELQRLPSVRRMGLEPFGREELAIMAASHFGRAPSDTEVDELMERTGGIPFVADQILAAGPGADRVPGQLRDVLLGSLLGLSASAGVLLREAAAIGEAVDHDLLAAVTTTDEREVLRSLRELVDRRLLVATNDGYRFRHGLVREVVYGEVLAGERAAIHRRVAEAIASREAVSPGSWASVLAFHWERAGDRHRALAASVAAGDNAEAMGAFGEASEHYERALGLWGRVTEPEAATGVGHLSLLQRAGDAAGRAGHADRAVTRLRAAIAATDPAVEPIQAAVLLTALGNYLGSAGDEREVFAVHEQAARLVKDHPPSAEQASVLARRAQALLTWARPQEAEAAAEEAVMVATAVGAEHARWSALLTLGACIARRGGVDRAVALFDDALIFARDHGDIELLCRAYRNLSSVFIAGGRLSDAVDTAREGAAVARRLGVFRGEGAWILSNAAWALFELGRWDECRRELMSIEDADPPGLTQFEAATLAANLSLAQGRSADADAQLARAHRLAGRASGWTTLQLALLDSTAALAENRLDDARAAVARYLADHDGGGDPMATAGSHLRMDVADLLDLLALGVRAEAEAALLARANHRPQAVRKAAAAAADLAARARSLAGNTTGARATAARAEIEAERGRVDGNSDPGRWATMIDANEGLSRPYRTARARHRRAESLLSQPGHRHEAATELRAGLAAALGLDARPLADEIDVLARRARLDLEADPERVTRHPRADRSTPGRSGGLTQRELDVLRLLAAGRTNPEIAEALFISRKTASNHVSHILTKLDVTNRVEAAAAGHRLGLLSSAPEK
jgi:DNA-binding CsgD family transcriptional regulator/tetratricopeptide (TPR) repeat protein